MRIFMPADEHESMRALSDDQIQQFIRDGFVRIDRAFPRELADEARTILWRDTGCDPHNQATWTKPVIRLSGYKDAPFLKAERTPVLHAAFDRIVGEGRWRLGSLGFGGTFVVRFPHPDEPGDDSWHIDTSFSPDGGDPNERRANVRSRGRALLMLLLFSDVGPPDAPRRRPSGQKSNRSLIGDSPLVRTSSCRGKHQAARIGNLARAFRRLSASQGRCSAIVNPTISTTSALLLRRLTTVSKSIVPVG